jgi:tetratricopeptide (TPR) repeat protein
MHWLTQSPGFRQVVWSSPSRYVSGPEAESGPVPMNRPPPLARRAWLFGWKMADSDRGQVIARSLTRRTLRGTPLITLSLALLFFSSGRPARAASLGADLATRAQTALVQGQIPFAVILLRGAFEILEDSKTLFDLAQAQSIAGQFAEAIEGYERLLKMSPSKELQAQAQAEIKRLKEAPAPFSDELLRQLTSTADAKHAFTEGVKLARAKKNLDAIRHLRAALVLDPMLPGPYRVLGAIYERLHDPKKMADFLQDYLRIRPDGPIADEIRKRLKPSGVLASVDLDASFPCRLWVNGRPLDKETPQSGFLLPSGFHTISYVSADLHIIRNRRIRLTPGQTLKNRFDFGALSVKLEPWARIRSEGRDIGLWDLVGLPVGSYQLELVANDNSKQKSLKIEIRPGKTTVIDKW